ncbi:MULTISPECIES: NAD-dependent protein deacetylase [Nocardiaceae]|uniref:NAD-dependent protein deacetylase n=1 Tax=Nocardiaceae TaxID=85025 RepID=UPI0005230235|nr:MULTISPECIES: NAD-dependent protein deacetylase [Rhodococcus]OZD12795.1 NAD-dependent deacetylase [Rhodococcus sp. 06-156-4C]OZD24419.1 NAD-dependent deacetylase [Rhodococcus sp. 06-156-3C]OZD27529.1 NAD-dependent deacetylase [Rhodococcus sp. 06-156-4a]OZD37293.1 NAD-dependent deacetylase [Rhodococcus sp. 06-156-3b]OZD41226.1 NAD-dependent deacetylase [Rhodococcus sp. 06-156-3]
MATTVRAAPSASRLDDIVELLTGKRVAVVSGAGMSTDSGIPDYRGPDSPPRNPMTFQQFVGDDEFRRHYWARNHVGWRHMDAAQPNRGHRALAALERRGNVSGVITQNVDMLHTKAGSRRVIDLHGVYARVTCLDCGRLVSRYTLARRLETRNPGFLASVAPADGVEIAPDADAVISSTAHFRMVDCEACGGVLKPDIVYFGESVPKPRVAEAFDLVDSADALLVLGSSLTVMSGLRFVRRAAKAGIPIVVVNRGSTRGDEFASIVSAAGCSETLTGLLDALPPTH